MRIMAYFPKIRIDRGSMPRFPWRLPARDRVPILDLIGVFNQDVDWILSE